DVASKFRLKKKLPTIPQIRKMSVYRLFNENANLSNLEGKAVEIYSRIFKRRPQVINSSKKF
ncbi:hypothetical protein HMI55_002273, partial [Coelomomyces lativittatus]